MNERYSRQILFKPIAEAGQQNLLNSKILIVGCGALGCSHAETLARAGVGKIKIVDRDFVEFSNLQRQTLYAEKDAEERLPKAIAAKNRLSQINSAIEIEAIVADVTLSNIEFLIENCDLVIDGTDNFQVRYLINDACVKLGKPWIYGAAVAGYGTTMTVFPNETPCLRCIFEEIPDAGSAPTCDTAGVIAPIISTISAIQTAEAVKILTKNFQNLHRSLIQVDIWQNDWRKIKPGKPNPDCETCAKRNFEFLNAENIEFSAALCGRNAVQISPPKASQIDLQDFAKKISPLGEIKQNEYLVRFTAENHEITLFKDARAIIRGTDDISRGRALYAKYVGV